jgi:hypothetical protein
VKKYLPHIAVLGAYILLWAWVSYGGAPGFVGRAVARSLGGFGIAFVWLLGIAAGLFVWRQRHLLALSAAGGAGLGVILSFRAGLSAPRIAGLALATVVVAYAVNAAASVMLGYRLRRG